MHQGAPPIGVREKRLEDPRLLLGQGRYVGDLRFPGMLYAHFVRCPHGHARIVHLGLDRARAMPGVEAVFAAGDLPALGRPMTATFQIPGVEIRMPTPLAREVIRCAGEAVAVVLAGDAYRAADAAEAVEVEYDTLPPVLDPLAAMMDDAPRVHDDIPANLAGHTMQGFGDVDAAFRDAPVVVRERFRVERSTGAAMEPRAVCAVPGAPDDRYAVTVWDSTQAPHVIRRSVAATLEIDPEQVRVIAPDVGGGFGPKGRYYPEEAAVATIAMHLGRPVLWTATRHEDLLATYGGRGLVAEAAIAADGEGRILGYRVHLIQDCGAYLPTATIVSMNTAQHLLGAYRLPSFHVQIDNVYTNKIPLTPLRGGGREMGVYVTERMIDRLAQRLGLPPHEVRERNVVPPLEFPYDTHYPSRAGGTVVYDSGDYPGHLRKALETIGYDEFKRRQPDERVAGQYRGIAVTLFLESTGFDRETARIEIGEDGEITLTVGSPSNGQSHATTFPQVCAANLGVPLETISYQSGDTGLMDQGTGTFGSRMAVTAGNATAAAARTLRERLLRAAADDLEAAPEDLELVDGVIRVRGVPDRGIALRDFVARARERGQVDLLVETHAYQPEKPSTFSGGAHAAIVEVDVETGWVRVERYLVVHDCGTVINPMVVEGQVHGGVTHGLSDALGERSVYDDDGRLITGTFATYMLPVAEMVPRFEVEHNESPSPFNPEGIKGAGEGGTIGALATIAAAVEDALEPLGVRLTDLPLRYEELCALCAPLREVER
jgi:aerobic carbon-monoxide dehydrogenase large subunit